MRLASPFRVDEDFLSPDPRDAPRRMVVKPEWEVRVRMVNGFTEEVRIDRSTRR